MEFEGLDRECARARKETSDRTAELISVNIALEEAKQREQRLTTHDILTNLPNRQLFQELLANAVEYGKRHQNSLAVLVGWKGCAVCPGDAAQRLAATIVAAKQAHRDGPLCGSASSITSNITACTGLK